MKRKQFPLSLAWAATIHKYQGQSVNVIVIGGYEVGMHRARSSAVRLAVHPGVRHRRRVLPSLL